MGQVGNPGSKDKTYLKLAKVQQSRELEGTPASKLNPRTEEVEGEGGGHGAKELGDGDKNQEHSMAPGPAFSGTVPPKTQGLPETCKTGAGIQGSGNHCPTQGGIIKIITN